MSEGGPSHEDDDIEGVQKVVEKEHLVCIGLIGIRDIIRKEVPGAVA
jgi:magnesium-transporting ATPase (P-type)